MGVVVVVVVEVDVPGIERLLAAVVVVVGVEKGGRDAIMGWNGGIALET